MTEVAPPPSSSEKTPTDSNMEEPYFTDGTIMEEQFTDCILQAPDILALHGLDDDDTTQSSMIQEDRSFMFEEDDDDDDDDGEESIYQDADDGSQRVALHAYQSAKGLWVRGKETFGVSTVLGFTESVCNSVAHAVGVSDFEKDLVTPQLKCVDENLQPTYTAIANVWESWSSSAAASAQREKQQQQKEEAQGNPSKPIFELDMPESFGESDEENWIPLDLPKTTTSCLKESISRLDSIDR